jgi:DNA (cytosine-5)-methyltransferase 1
MPRPATDPYALRTSRGFQRVLEPRLDPDSERDRHRWRQRMRRSKRPLCVSLWSGAGGLDLGLDQAGYDVVVAADHDDVACQTHGHNGHALVFSRDLADPDQTRRFLRDLELPQITLLVGGFPCQPYSRAGQSIIRHLVESERRPEVDKRTLAWRSFVAAVDEIRPRQALAENVPDLYRYNDGALLRDIVEALGAIGYRVDVRILVARSLGVPQYRERLFIQAAQEPISVVWPTARSETHTTLRDAIGDLPPIPAGHQEDPMTYEPGATASVAWAREGIVETADNLLFDHICRDVRKDDLLAFEQLDPGGTYLDIPPELRRYDDEHFTDKYKRLEWDKPSRTITAHIARDGYWYIHPEQHRTLSVREAARVQTFPDWFVFAGHPSRRFQQIGNAVPPLLGRAVGEALLNALHGRGTSSNVPSAAERLKRAADEFWQPWSDWQLIVSEVVFSARARPDRVYDFVDRFPDAESAARIRSPKGHHERIARSVARRLLKEPRGALPTHPDAAQKVTGAPAAVARSLVAMRYGIDVPRSVATIRVTERVSGQSRAGSLNGVSHPVLSRLASFGQSPSANQLLVDIGRNVCLPEDPLCDECPLQESCAYPAVDEAAEPLDGTATV